MGLSILEVIRSRRNAGNTASIILCTLLCDTYADLPTPTSITGVELEQGCVAIVIDENAKYRMNSSGTWYISGETFVDVYTKQQTDTLLNAKQDALTSAQLGAVNSGITAAILQELQSYHTIKGIPSNSDVNDYSDRGIYTVGSASVAATINNSPFTSAGYIMFVLPSYQAIGSTRGKIQIAVTRIATITNVKLRWYAYGSGVWSWNAWETILP